MNHSKPLPRTRGQPVEDDGGDKPSRPFRSNLQVAPTDSKDIAKQDITVKTEEGVEESDPNNHMDDACKGDMDQKDNATKSESNLGKQQDPELVDGPAPLSPKRKAKAELKKNAETTKHSKEIPSSSEEPSESQEAEESESREHDDAPAAASVMVESPRSKSKRKSQAKKEKKANKLALQNAYPTEVEPSENQEPEDGEKNGEHTESLAPIEAHEPWSKVKQKTKHKKKKKQGERQKGESGTRPPEEEPSDSQIQEESESREEYPDTLEPVEAKLGAAKPKRQSKGKKKAMKSTEMASGRTHNESEEAANEGKKHMRNGNGGEDAAQENELLATEKQQRKENPIKEKAHTKTRNLKKKRDSNKKTKTQEEGTTTVSSSKKTAFPEEKGSVHPKNENEYSTQDRASAHESRTKGSPESSIARIQDVNQVAEQDAEIKKRAASRRPQLEMASSEGEVRGRTAVAAHQLSPEAIPAAGIHQMNSVDSINFDIEEGNTTAGPGVLDLPITAHLAPDEDYIAERITERIHAEMADRLEREVAERVQVEQTRQVVAEAVEVEKDEEDPTEICGITPSRTCWLIFAAASLAIIVIIVGVVIAVVGGDDGDGPLGPPPTAPPNEETPLLATITPTDPPTAPPTETPQTESFEELYSLIGPDITVDLGILRDMTTPQYEALAWLANTDPAGLDFWAVPKQLLIERYALVLFYLTTDGHNWDSQLDFLGPFSVCDWVDNTGLKGVFCDGQYVNEISLGMSFEFGACISLLTLQLFSSLSNVSQMMWALMVPFHQNSPCSRDFKRFGCWIIHCLVSSLPTLVISPRFLFLHCMIIGFLVRCHQSWDS
jgi:hypothetical protein